MTAATMSPEDLLIPLASAHGNLEVVKQLSKGQCGKRMLQLRMMLDQCAAAPSDGGELMQPREWYALLGQVQRAAPHVFRAVLLDPDVAVCLGSRAGDPRALGRIAAAAAILARIPATITLAAQDGEVFLPGLGTVVVGDAGGAGGITLRVGTDGVTVDTAGAPIALPPDLACTTAQWRPIRCIKAGKDARIEVRFAADGPIGAAFGALYPADSTQPPDAEEWQRALTDAWQILETGHRVHASSIAAGVRAIAPIATGEDGSFVSATRAGAFGAIALSMPSQPEHFAVTLVHEFQHAKLDAALDLIPLYTADDSAVYYAPWRPDPRPLGALVQGIYAHLGVAHFWSVQRWLMDGRRALCAHLEFVRWRDDTWQACKELIGAPSLTAAGEMFVQKLMDELDQLRSADVPPEAARLADLVARDHKISWRLRNLQMDQPTARRFASAWLKDSMPMALPAKCVRQTDTPRTLLGRRTLLLYRHLNGRMQDASQGSSRADFLYAAGSYGDALGAYEDGITSNPGDLDAWAGMALAASAQGGAASDVLTAMPEVAAEIYRQASFIGPQPRRPLQLAHWLSKAG